MTDKKTPMTPELIAEARMKLVQARIKLLFGHPFFGQLALRLQLVNADGWCPTAATDGRSFFYNPTFINKLDPPEVVFLVAHELGHCIYEHFIRKGPTRDAKLWNIAGDYVINNMLDNEIVKKGGTNARVITTVQPFLDHKYDGLTTEEVYDLVEKNGKGKGQLIDVHIDLTGSGDDGKGKGKGNSKGNGSKPSPMSSDEIKELQNELRDALIQASQGAGDVPGDIKRMIGSITDPQMDWREILQARIESSIKSNYTWMRPNRKGWHMNAILPGMDNDFKIDVVLAIDTSGSISQKMLQDFVGEVSGIMEQYEDYRIRIWQFDTKIYGYDEFTSDDGRDISEYNINGGGGTNFAINWEYMENEGIMPDQFIMFTDGEPFGDWGDPDYCDTVFLIHTKYGRPVAPFGETVYYET